MAKTFKQAMDRIKEVAQNNAVSLQKNFAVDMLTEFAIYTPIDEGYANANWVLRAKAPELKPFNITDKSFTGRVARANAERASSSVKVGDDVYVSNAVQGRDEDGSFNGEGYIIGLDKGKSQQAPAGMFYINLAKAPIIVKKSKKRLFK